MTPTSVPPGFTLPCNTEWTVADSWGLTKAQCQNVKYRTEKLDRKATARAGWAQSETIWTNEAIRKLTALWLAGVTCSQIAKVLGPKFTRNSVIGKVRRLGLPGRRSEEVA